MGTFVDASNVSLEIVPTPTHRIYQFTGDWDTGETQAALNLRQPIGGRLDRYESRIAFDGAAPVTPSIQLYDENDVEWFGGLASGELRSMSITGDGDVSHFGAFYAELGGDRATEVWIMGRPTFVVNFNVPTRGVFKMFVQRF